MIEDEHRIVGPLFLVQARLAFVRHTTRCTARKGW
jgi:hypothetical protein